MTESASGSQGLTPAVPGAEPQQTSAPSGGRLGSWVLVATLVGVAVTWGAGEIITSSPDIRAWDRSIVRWLAARRSGGLTEAMRLATLLGGTTVVVVLLGLTIGATYLRTRREQWLLFLVATSLGTFLIDNLVKTLVQRSRPSFARITEVSGPAFPSGHSAMAAALFVSSAFVASRWIGGRASVLVWGGACALAALVGFSRVYLGAHWTTDVLFGLALGTFWTLAMARACGIRPGSEEDSTDVEPVPM